jgi:hypothetical protein
MEGSEKELVPACCIVVISLRRNTSQLLISSTFAQLY